MGYFVGLLTSILVVAVRSDFGDYVDPTFDCPATTSCPQVCVASVQDCPVEMRCQDNETLCADGSCAASCPPELESPCQFDCASVACHKVVDDYDSCNSIYAPLYEQEAACGEEEEAMNRVYSLTEPAFVVLYVWFAIVTCLIVAWCAYNQRIAPVAGSTQVMDDERCSIQDATSWQTGYKIHPIGASIYVMTLVTLFGFHAILAYLTIQFYVTGEAPRLEGLHVAFPDEENLLKAFITVWMVGFVWSFGLKWPHSIHALFLRRCVLDEATHVAVCVSQDTAAEIYANDYIGPLRRFCSSFTSAIDRGMTFVFSDVDAYGRRKGRNGIYEYCPVRTNDDGSRYFVFLFRRYILETADMKEETQNDESQQARFVPGHWEMGTNIATFVSASKSGLTNDQVLERRRIVGPNTVEVAKPSFLRSLLNEVSKPFYTYQSFMVWSWFPLWYYYMAITWTVVITTSALTVTFFQYRNDCSLYKLTKITGQVQVKRDGETVAISKDDLVPGDVVELDAGLTHCDMVVVETTATLVDESALTGEATPVAKTPVDEADGETFDRKRHKRHTILAGTSVLETDDTCAVVLQTASYTARGELLREIYSHKRHLFKFDVEVPVVITILFLYAILGFALVIYFIQDTPVYGWFYGIYVVASALPPLLPTVFTVSVGVSVDRLARKRIASTQSETILVAGKVNRAFFDKTGTLTKQGLDFMSVRCSSSWDAEGHVSDEMSQGMAVCHSLSLSKESGIVIGNPVDREMFAASRATLQPGMKSLLSVTTKSGEQLDIVKHFDFDHHRMTQSVVVKDKDGNLTAYVKGSSQNVKAICKSESIPEDFESIVRDCAKTGIYQIAMAVKTLSATADLSALTRDDVESDVSFAGLINFKNVIREETRDVICQLDEGAVRSTVITGDSVLTGICIAREAGIIKGDSLVLIGSLGDDGKVVWTDESDDETPFPSAANLSSTKTELAIYGNAWSVLCSEDPDTAASILECIRVFGRCTPQDKVSIVAASIELGFVTLMCGDGGNDCGALKTAHVGIALSDAEASIVAPFTSLDKTIASVIEVLKEGRCALASALASYKFMIMYGQITTMNQIINAYFLITFSEWCWVFIDGIWAISLAFTLPLARSAKNLAKTFPTASLLGPQTLASVLGILALDFIFLASGLAYLFNQDWFQCRKWGGRDVSNVLVIGDNYETTVIFLITAYQYISAGMAFNFGYEFRQAWIRNYMFVILVLFYTILVFYITLNPGRFSCIWRVNCTNDNVTGSVTSSEAIPIQNPFNTTVMPLSFSRGMLGLMIGNALAVCGWDYFVVNGIRRHYGKVRSRKSKLTDNTESTAEGEDASYSQGRQVEATIT